MVANDGHRVAEVYDLLARVNLRDFRDMVVGEFQLVWSALAATIRSPSFLTPAAIIAAFLRLLLLAIVVIVLGTAITVVVAIRSLLRPGSLLGKALRTTRTEIPPKMTN